MCECIMPEMREKALGRVFVEGKVANRGSAVLVLSWSYFWQGIRRGRRVLY